MLPSALIYWHNWSIFQLILPYTSYSASRRRLERHLGMRLLIQIISDTSASPYKRKWSSCPNVIWYNSKYRASPSPLKTCSSRTTNMIGSCTTQGNIESTHIERIQVDHGFALSIILKRLLYFLDIPLSSLSTTTMIIYGFNTESSHPLGKINLQCQIGDQKLEVTCYVIDADTSYILLLGRSWIHANWIVPSRSINASNVDER